MENQTTDRRIKKTRKQLLTGLTKLMGEKSVKDITVRELSDLVDINRSTFYLHYKDIFDMVEQIENEMFERFNEVFLKHQSKKLNGKPLPMLIDVFHFVAENSEMALVLLSKNGDNAFTARLKSIVKNKCLNDWMELFNTGKTEYYEMFYSYIVSGCIGLIQYWLENGMKESSNQMATVAQEMILNGIKILK